MPNRALFLDRLSFAVSRAARSGNPVGVLFIDIDDFKTINDSLGHRAGDELLQAVAGRLEACLRPSDTIARLGGDEFAVLIEEIDDTAGRRHGGEPGPRLPRRSDRDRGARGVRGGKRRDRRRPAGRGDAAARRRPRDVPGQGGGQGPIPRLRPPHARRHRRADGARGRPQARDRGQRAGAPLPADLRPQDRCHRRARGSRAVEPSRPAGSCRPDSFIPHAEVQRADIGSGALGPCRGLPPGSALARPLSRHGRNQGRGQPFGVRAPRRGDRRRRSPTRCASPSSTRADSPWRSPRRR